VSILDVTDLDAGHTPGRPVLRGLSLSLDKGQILSLLGPNGAGKTTVMLTVSGLINRLGGSVTLDGRPLKSGNARAAARAGLVLVPDDRSLFTTLTVEENLKLAGDRAGRDRVLAYFPRLTERLKLAAGQLSGGEQQMLAIGRALTQNPKVLLIDELSMGLAPVIVETLLPVIRQVADDTGAAVILVEQHVQLALGIADHAIVIAHGQEALRGPAQQLTANPKTIEHAYLGTPQTTTN